MKFLLDQGPPRSTVQHLQALGLDAEHVGALGLAAATDEAILAEGCARGAIVVTLDADFHAILARSGAAQPSVVRIRIQGFQRNGVRLAAEGTSRLATRKEVEAEGTAGMDDHRNDGRGDRMASEGG